MDVNQDVLMQVCSQVGKVRQRAFVGSFNECYHWAEQEAEKFRQRGWTVLHDDSECEWIFERGTGQGTEPDFELVIGDCDDGSESEPQQDEFGVPVSGDPDFE